MKALIINIILFFVSSVYPAAYDQDSPYSEISFYYDGIRITAPQEIATKIVMAMVLLDTIHVYNLIHNTHIKSIEIDYYPSEYNSHARAYCFKESKKVYFVCDQNNTYNRDNFLNLSYKEIAVSIMHESFHLNYNLDGSLPYKGEEELAHKLDGKIREMVRDY